MNSQYIDKNGKIPKPGDKIRFDLYDGISNIEFIFLVEKTHSC